MNCPACLNAERHPRSAEFTLYCTSCQARAIAAIGAYDESRAVGALTAQFKGVLREVFKDNAAEGYAHVKAWAAKIGKTK